MLSTAWRILTSSSDWKYEKSCAETGDVIASRQSEEGRKIFKLTVELNIILSKLVFKSLKDPLSNNGIFIY